MNLKKKILNNFLNVFVWFKKLSLKKKGVFIIVCIVILVIGIGQIRKLTQPPPYKISKVEKSDITQVVTETGNIIAGGSVVVYSPTNGIVQKVQIKNGDSVKAGQELFTVESSATEQEKQLAYSNYLTAKAALNAAESAAYTLRSSMYSNWEIFRNLATNSTYENDDETPKKDKREAAEFQMAQDNWLAAEKKYKDQETAAAQARAQLGSSWLLYQATQNAIVKAPIAGTIANLSISPNSSILSQATATAFASIPPALQITNSTTTEALISLSESDIAKLKPGQEARIDVSSVEGKIYKGIVRRVDTIGTLNQGVVRYNVYIEIVDADSHLRSGMTVDAEIITSIVKNVLSVPNSAVKPYKSGKAVRIPGKKKGETEYIPVEIGVKGETKTQILKGLSENQEVITSLSNEQIKRSGLFGN